MPANSNDSRNMRPIIGPVDDEFLRVLFAEDEIGAVVRAHIMIEVQVNGLIDCLVMDSESLPQLRFEQRVRLLVALGASKELEAPLIELGRIRNAFAHRLDTRLDSRLIAKWIQMFPRDDLEMMERATEATCVALSQPLVKLREHNAKSQFILIAVFIRQALRQMQAELDAKHKAAV